MRYLAFRLSDDFRRCSLVVRQPIVFVRVLVAMKILAGLTLSYAMAFPKRFIISLERIGLDELCAMRLNTELTLPARVTRYNDLNGNIHHCSKHRVCNPGIAGTRVQHDLSFPNPPLNQCF